MPEAAAPALPVIYRCTIGPEWVDFNGHLRDGYYMVLFSSAVDALMDLAGLDYSEYRNASWDGRRYAVVSHLLSVSLNQRVRVKVCCLVPWQ